MAAWCSSNRRKHVEVQQTTRNIPFSPVKQSAENYSHQSPSRLVLSCSLLVDAQILIPFLKEQCDHSQKLQAVDKIMAGPGFTTS